ncbi:MAG: hypothetical protein ACYDEF_03710 [Methanosarcina sp.]
MAVILNRRGSDGSFFITVPIAIINQGGWVKGECFVCVETKNGFKFTRGSEKDMVTWR